MPAVPHQGLSCRSAADLSGLITREVDVVVVGSGAGGAVVACELAAAGRSVLILEAGPYVPSADFREDFPEALDQLYARRGLQTNDRHDLNVLQGACVGGSTVVNACICFRTPDFVLEAWRRDHGLTALTPEALAPYFERAEENLSIHDNDPHERNANARAVVRGCEALGISWRPLRRNTKGCALTGHCLSGCATDRKQSMLVTYLPWALANGAELYADTRVRWVMASNGEATGVNAEVFDPQTGAKVADLVVLAKVVVVAAGAVQTPLLLDRSGLCAGSGQLGRNFACHPSVGVVGRFDEEIHLWRGALVGVYVDEYMHPEKGGFILESAGAGPFELSVFADTGLGPDHDAFMAVAKHDAAMITLIHDQNVGRVYGDADGVAHIDYTITAADFEATRTAIKAAGRIWFAAGARKVLLPTIPGRVVDRAEDLDAAVDDIPHEPFALRMVSYHPQGTARMGADPQRSVVGPYGETHEVKRLFVADASLFPTSILVNPQLTVYGLAGYIADQIHSRFADYFTA